MQTFFYHLLIFDHEKEPTNNYRKNHPRHPLYELFPADLPHWCAPQELMVALFLFTFKNLSS